MKLLKLKTFLPLFSAAATILAPRITMAAVQMPEVLSGTDFTSVGGVISFIFNALIIVGAIVVFVMFAIGGIIYLTGAGNEEQTGKAKKLLIDAIIGFAILLAAYAIARFVLQLFLGDNNLPEIEQ